MQQSEKLYQGFLEEMQALETFRMTYTAVHPEAALERDDPEVRRLIEAMAFFSARTRDSALRNLLATRRRLFQQFFSFLLAPLPAMGLLQAKPTGRFAEPAVLPKGSEVLVTPEGGQGAFFRTVTDLRILPVWLDGIDMLLLPKEGYRLVIQISAAFPRNDEIGTLPVLVTHLNNYNASLQVLELIRRHVRRAFVVFDERATEISDGPAVELLFGPPPATDEAPQPLHPIQEARSLLHFPERELYVNFKLPSPPRNWRRFSLCVDLGPEWPKNLRLNKDLFQLFTVPIVNLRRMKAQPILCDGKIERYAIRYPDPTLKFALHSVLGVYQIEKKGMTPLRPGIVLGGSGSYEIERSEGPDASAETSWLKLQFPEAFEEPKKISIDAEWFQPWFSALAATARLSVALYDRVIAGVDFDLQGEIRPHRENPLRNDVDGLLQMLALKNKAVLNLDDVRTILNGLGTVGQGTFKQVAEWFTDLSVQVAPKPRERGGIRHVYQFRMKDFDPTYRAIVEVLLRQLLRLLNAWVSDVEIAIEATTAGGGERIALEPEATERL